MAGSGILLMKQHCVLTHTVYQTEIPALLDSWFTNTPVRVCTQKIACPYIFVKT